MTGTPFDPMTDERSEREIRRFLDWEVEGIPGAPSEAEMVDRLHRATRPAGIRRGFLQGTPAFRVVVVLGLLAALAAGALAVGALLNQRDKIVPPRTVTMAVAGTEDGGASLQASVELPSDWSHDASMANPDTTDPSAQLGFFLSVVDNTFEDPCAHIERSPKIGTSVAAVAAALGEIPGTTATSPDRASLADYEATQVDITIPGTLPCSPDQFYLWRDGTDAISWPSQVDEVLRVSLVSAGGYTVAIASRTYPETSADAIAELQVILDSISFDSPPPLMRAGAIQPGTYEMTADFTGIPLTFTVPAGWSINNGWIESGDPWDDTGLAFGSYVISHVYADACNGTADLIETSTRAEISTALAAQIGPETTGPTEVTLGGLPASLFELSVAPEFDVLACDADLLHIWPDLGGDESGGFPLDPGQTATVHVLERDGINTEIVAIWNVDSSPDRVAELQAMVSSVQFLP